MATFRYLAYSILEALKESKDDSDIKLNTVVFWIQVEANRLRKERLEKRILQSGEYLAHFSGVEVKLSGYRKYFALPSDIIDLQNDNGINLVTYHLEDFDYCDNPMTVPFHRTSPAEYWALMSLPTMNATPQQPYFAREGLNVFLYGIEQVNVSSVDVWLYTAVNPTIRVNLDEECPVPEDQISILNYRVMGLVRFGLLMPNDKSNTGSDGNTKAIAKTAISQANIPTENQQQES